MASCKESIQRGYTYFGVLFIVFLIGLVVYYIAKFVQKSRGVNVDLSFKQVPEE